MISRSLAFILGCFFLFVFVVFSYLVARDLFTQLDFDITVRLQDNIPRRVDDFFSWFSTIGNFETSLIVLIILIFLWRRALGLIALGFFVLFHIIEIFGKSYVTHLPPPQFMLRTHHPFDFPQFHVRLEHSFPSGHSGRAIFLTVILAFVVFKSKKLNFATKLIIWAILIGYDAVMLLSRVYLGEHWTTDVVGGALLGLSMGLMAAAFFGGSIKEIYKKIMKFFKKETSHLSQNFHA